MKNTGIEIPTSAKNIAPRSNRDRGRKADRIPMGIPTSNQMMAAPTASWIVTNARSRITGFRGARRTNDWPSPGQPHSSPRKRFRVNV